MSISLCMIVKNEQDNLPRCLESVRGVVDEMIIVDTGSADATVQIAESYGAKVYAFPWTGDFSAARNHSLKFAASDWILLMDADDELDVTAHEKIRELASINEADAYFFKTVSYIGDTPGLDTLNNLNIRLLRNGKGYFFCNPIHEQIYSVIKAVNPSAAIRSMDIKVYHYGYLNKNIVNQNKRKRNIEILEKELEQNPGYGFALFNLGNEYFASGNLFKAMEYYEQSYGKFDKTQGYSSKLLLKMVNCYMNAGRNEKALKLIDEGLDYYPDFTELEYFRALIYFNQYKLTLALRHFERCLKMGESPLHINMVEGAGTYRASFMLGEIYFLMEDYGAAAENYERSVGYNGKFTPSVIKLYMALCKMKPGNKALKSGIDKAGICKTENYDTGLYTILIREKYYELALEYIRADEKRYGAAPCSFYYSGLCKLMLKKYKNAFALLEQIENDQEFGVRAACAHALGLLLEKRYKNALLLLNRCTSEKDGKLLKVYGALCEILAEGKNTVLSEEEEESKLYTPIIFDLLEILLSLHEFELFEKALNLLNSVDDKTVLLRLAKLYFHEDCCGLACQELIRSIKTYGLIDAEGASILHRLKIAGINGSP